ncbi:MAG: LysR substrate-binding domain-containing protein [Caulobacteraceae bacterium]
MPAILPIEVLRSFVAIVDCGSMLKASERVFLTQSALSLQVKRLEEMLQQPLFHRDGRRLVLAPAGEVLLQYAREMLALNDQAISAVSGGALDGPVRIGMVQDFAETLLTRILAQFAALHPEAALHARIGGTAELLEELEKDRMDLLIGFAEPGSKADVRVEPMVWIGDPDLAAREVLPLAVLERPCRFREAAIAALEAAGRPYRIVLETPNLSTLRAAVEARLGLSCRTPLFGATALDGAAAGLPPLPAVACSLWTARSLTAAQRRLESLVRTALSEWGSEISFSEPAAPLRIAYDLAS